MSYALDTSVLIDIERNYAKTIEQLKKLNHNEELCIPFMSYTEFLVGIENKNIKNKLKAINFVDSFPFIQPTKQTARIHAELKIKYKTSGSNIAGADLFIASQVKEHNMILITKDKDFQLINDIKTFFIA